MEQQAPEFTPRPARPPLDPRLIKHVRPVRRFLILGAALAVVQAMVTIAFAIVLGSVMAGVITKHWGGSQIGAPLVWLTGLVVARVVLTYLQTRFSQHSAGTVIADLQHRVLRSALATPLRHSDAVALHRATTVTSGLESLRPYFTGYLPSLLTATILTPLVVLMVFWRDPLSALIAILTLPLIPVFMWLIGRLTEGRSAARLRALRNLESLHHDLLAGLPTLIHAGRVGGMGKRVRQLSETYRQTSMSTLRYAFLSALVLEWLTTLCVALIAVAIGLRLINGDISLESALIVLILAPEIYLPLRQLGAQFHASDDGLAAVDAVFDAIEEDAAAALPPVCEATRSNTAREVGSITFSNISVKGRSGFAPLRASGTIRQGEITAIVGPSGAGKTTLVNVLLGVGPAHSGTVQADHVETPVRKGAIPRGETNIYVRDAAYLEQRPLIFPATVRENLCAFLPSPASQPDPPTDAELLAALTSARALTALAPHAQTQSLSVLDLRVGHSGSGLSRGEAQRLALARLLLNPAQVIIADEPTAHLDEATQALVVTQLRRLADAGRTVIVVAHRPELIRDADQVIRVST